MFRVTEAPSKTDMGKVRTEARALRHDIAKLGHNDMWAAMLPVLLSVPPLQRQSTTGGLLLSTLGVGVDAMSSSVHRMHDGHDM